MTARQASGAGTGRAQPAPPAGGRNQGKWFRHRAVCHRCGRETATTGNARTGERYFRPHVKAPGDWCVRPGEVATMRREAGPRAER